MQSAHPIRPIDLSDRHPYKHLRSDPSKQRPPRRREYEIASASAPHSAENILAPRVRSHARSAADSAAKRSAHAARYTCAVTMPCIT